MAKAKWKRYSLEFKRGAVERMRGSENVTELAQELRVSRTVLYIWKGQLEGRPERRRADLSQTVESRREQKLVEENRLLKEALGEKTLEADFFASALRRTAEQRQSSTGSGGKASTSRSGRGRSKRKAN